QPWLLTVYNRLFIPIFTFQLLHLHALLSPVKVRLCSQECYHRHTETEDGMNPPAIAEFGLCFFLAKKQREAVPGDLAEQYRQMHERFGKNAASAIYVKDALLSLLPLFTGNFTRLLKWASIGWIGDCLRRLFSHWLK